MFRSSAALVSVVALAGSATAMDAAAQAAVQSLLDRFKSTGHDITCSSSIAPLSFECAKLFHLSPDGTKTPVAEGRTGVTLTSGTTAAALYENVGVLPDGTRIDYKVRVCRTKTELGEGEIGPDPKHVTYAGLGVKRPSNPSSMSGTSRVQEVTYSLENGTMSLATSEYGWTSMCAEFVDPSGKPVTVTNVGFTVIDGIDSDLSDVMACGVDGKITSENSDPPVPSVLLTKAAPQTKTIKGETFVYPADCVLFSTLTALGGQSWWRAGEKMTEDVRKFAGAFLMNSVDQYKFGLGSFPSSLVRFTFDPKSVLGCPASPRDCAPPSTPAPPPPTPAPPPSTPAPPPSTPAPTPAPSPSTPAPPLSTPAPPPSTTAPPPSTPAPPQQPTQQLSTPQPTEKLVHSGMQATVPTLKPQKPEPGLPACWAGGWGGGSQATCIVMPCGGGQSTCLDEYKKQLPALVLRPGDSNDPAASMAGGMTECDLVYKKVVLECPQCEKCTPPGRFTPKFITKDPASVLYEEGPPPAATGAAAGVAALWVAAFWGAAAAAAAALGLARSRGLRSRGIPLAASDAPSADEEGGDATESGEREADA